MTASETAQRYGDWRSKAQLLFRAVVGSTAYGLALEGKDDRDIMGVAIERPQGVLGLHPFEHHLWRTQPEGIRSGPGDLDLTIYGLKKFLRLALKGNPTITALYFVPPLDIADAALYGAFLETRRFTLSRRCLGSYRGYLQSQRLRMVGEKGAAGRVRKKRDGYDTKYAMHMVRVGYQGNEILRTGGLIFPMPEPARSMCMAIRRGEPDLGEVLALARSLEDQMGESAHASPLPPEPDRLSLDYWLTDFYPHAWAQLGDL